MGKILEQGLQQAKQFYIEQLIRAGYYQPQQDKELFALTFSELKSIYQNEAIPKLKDRIVH